MSPPHLDRYRAMITHLAGYALDLAEPHVDPSDHGSLAIGLPIARALLKPEAVDPAQLDAAWAGLAGSAGTLRDLHGHTRPAYAALVTAMARDASAAADHQPDDAALSAACAPVNASEGFDLDLFKPRLADNAAKLSDAAIEGAPDGSMHPFVDGQELIDVWWYRELVAIHALGAIALRQPPEARMRDRLERAVMHHVVNTQPDHTTAQPWGVAAFAFFPDAIPFADQQLHDAQANWTASGPAAALLPGIILADAAFTLAQAVAPPIAAP
ncbi:MAG: hypothetical protein AAF078_01215 [Planctomycetota bacterium]